MYAVACARALLFMPMQTKSQEAHFVLDGKGARAGCGILFKAENEGPVEAEKP